MLQRGIGSYLPGLCLLLAMLQPVSAQEEVRPPVRSEPEIVVPDGTVLPVVLTAYMNSRSTQVGDTFYSETVYPIWIQQRLVIPRGSLVKGTVTYVKRPGRIKGKGEMAVRFDSVLLPNGINRNLVASFRGIHGPGAEKIDRQKEVVGMDSTTGEDAGQVAGIATQGAIIGALADESFTGAGIGAGAGAAVGLATVLFSRGRDLILEPGTQFDLELKQPLRFAFGDIDFTAQGTDGGRRSYYPRRDREDQRRSYPRRLGWPGLGFPW
jgi:type IV secretion system protein VirB10